MISAKDRANRALAKYRRLRDARALEERQRLRDARALLRLLDQQRVARNRVRKRFTILRRRGLARIARTRRRGRGIRRRLLLADLAIRQTEALAKVAARVRP